MFDKIDYKTIHILGREVRVSINHHERSISARLGEHYPAELRITGYLAERLALGASVRVERGADEDLHVGLYLGPLRLYAGINNRLLHSLVETARLGRRVTSLEVSLADRYGEPENGAAINLRGHLWDDDNTSNAASRAISIDLLDSLLGKVVTSDKQVVDEREVVVPLPEGSFTTKARLVERFDSRPGWPFKRYHRWVEFRETPAVVPTKGGGTSFYNMGGPWTGITGRSFEEGTAELVRRVLEQRARYGSKAWATGVPSGGEHEVSVWRVVEGKEHEVWRGALGHGERQVIGAPVSPSLRVAIEPDGSFPDTGPPVVLKREPRHGGIVLDCGAILLPGHVLRGGDRLARAGDIPLVMQDEIHVRGEVFKVYGSPIGPAPASAPTQSGNVNAFNILAAAKAAGLHGVNAGPTLGHRVGRQALQGLPAAHALLAEQMDPQWFAANAEIVDGARKVHDASTFDVETRSWIEPSQAAQAAILRSEREAYERGLQWQANQTEQADVQEVLAQLDTTPPGPTEEADGLSLRERALAGARRYAEAFNASHTAVSALSEVLGDGTADLPPAPVDTRPWLPVGDLVVTVARGELKTTVRLARASSYRIGAHKDAEVRLLGAHMIAATLLQQDGAVWICRGADNVAVDLLGLDIRETVRLREGAEVQIGQLYTLTIASAAKPVA